MCAFHPSRGALAGVGLIGGFAAWCALSITWSIAPDEAGSRQTARWPTRWWRAWASRWGRACRARAERVAIGYLAMATAVALYALGGKLFPWLRYPGLIDLNHTERFSRLRAPLDYWNALGLVCVLAVPLGVRAAAELAYRRPTAQLAAPSRWCC